MALRSAYLTHAGWCEDADIVRCPCGPPINIDIGIVHYASDTPFSKGQNLGAQHLSYFGMDPTYAGTVTILRRILELESTRREGRER